MCVCNRYCCVGRIGRCCVVREGRSFRPTPAGLRGVGVGAVA